MLRAEELPLRDGGLSFTDVEPAPEIGPTCPGAPSFSRVPFSRGSECSPFACGDDASFCAKKEREREKNKRRKNETFHLKEKRQVYVTSSSSTTYCRLEMLENFLNT